MSAAFLDRIRLPAWSGYWLLLPLGGYPFVALFASAEGDTPELAFICALGVAICCGYICRLARGQWWEAPLSAAWLPYLLARRHMYWEKGLSSPAGPPQAFLREAGWTDASGAAALAVCLTVAALLGYAAGALMVLAEGKNSR